MSRMGRLGPVEGKWVGGVGEIRDGRQWIIYFINVTMMSHGNKYQIKGFPPVPPPSPFPGGVGGGTGEKNLFLRFISIWPHRYVNKIYDSSSTLPHFPHSSNSLPLDRPKSTHSTHMILEISICHFYTHNQIFQLCTKDAYFFREGKK